MKHIHEKTKIALQKSVEQMKTQYNKKKKTAIKYQKKLNNKHISPFSILEKQGLSIYKLKLSPT
ncbi:uncharacterized protein ARMOST_20360 [Armillaria ostoyae]|uniref:Uncharacterized protein n=1 Tax=Armillaria ostoyae TaxID=47428 RepID=A0A284S751_ARMOS|nr:uncharacterized protein ARMOST_20360 [Armillaria ostoyae]